MRDWRSAPWRIRSQEMPERFGKTGTTRSSTRRFFGQERLISATLGCVQQSNLDRRLSTWPTKSQPGGHAHNARSRTGQADAFSSSASERIPVTAIRADYEFAKAFYTPTVPRPRLGILRRLEGRCGGRHFFHGRRVDRNGARTRSTSNRKPSRQAEKEECIAHEYLPESSPSATTALPFGSTCCSETRV